MEKHQFASIALKGSMTLSYLQNTQQKDIIPGLYQGGFQLWQCTTDLLNFLTNFDFQDKVVLDLGCGHGLLGILSLLLGAKLVIFQDFNSVVLTNVTIPNINVNTSGSNLKDKCRFLTGDWENMEPMGVKCEVEKVDVIVGSEVIYNENNYGKIVGVMKQWMDKEKGCAVLANKQYYFGVGGNVNGFKEAAEENGFQVEVLEKIEPPKGGNKKEIDKITFKK